MLARVLRSGVVEAVHHGAVAVVHPDETVLAQWGDIDQTYYARSTAKPFQALAALRAGARFAPEELAVVCASHGGHPVQVALVEQVLESAGLDESHLRCPPAWPWAPDAKDLVIRQGHITTRRIWHNCSGKHAGMLAACVEAGWPLETYLELNHPLQRLVGEELAAAFGPDVSMTGTDSCGAPICEVTTRGVAHAYAKLATDARYVEVLSAMQRFGSLTARSHLEAGPSRWWDVASKQGAEGCFAMATRNRFGVALKSFDGSERPLWSAALATMRQLGVAPDLTDFLYAEGFEELGGMASRGATIEPMVSLV